MSRIISFGEAVIDMLADDADEAAPTYRCFAGGAPANVAVAAARLGADSAFAGRVGDDHFGRFLRRALERHDVDTNLTKTSPTGKTAIAFVALDETGERSFSFYGVDAAHLQIAPDDVPEEALSDQSILHLGSNTLTTQAARTTCADIADRARAAGAAISFDINYREGLWPHPAEASSVIAEFIEGADLLKASREELTALFGEEAIPERIEAWLSAGVSLVVVTDGPGDIDYFGRAGRGTITPPQVSAVDTTAAGDAFVGGLLARIAQSDAAPRAWLQTFDDVTDALSFAARCGASATTKHGAFSSLPSLADIQEL